VTAGLSRGDHETGTVAVPAGLSRGDHENGTVAVPVPPPEGLGVGGRGTMPGLATDTAGLPGGTGLAAGAVPPQPADNAAMARTAHPAVRKPRTVRMTTPS
jgi:hypothetical protein